MTATLTRALRKPLQPIRLTIEHLCYNAGLGLGTLDIRSDAVESDTYLLSAIRAGARLVRMRIVKLSSGDAHEVDLTATPWRCNCGDAVHRPGRPGGCRHVVALRQAAEELRKKE